MSKLLKLNPNFVPAFDGKAEAEKLLLKLRAELIVDSAYLFGSASIGKNTADSDLDILVVIPEGSNKHDYFRFVGKKEFSKIAVDWIFLTISEFDANKVIGGVAMVAFESGLKLQFQDQLPHG